MFFFSRAGFKWVWALMGATSILLIKVMEILNNTEKILKKLENTEKYWTILKNTEKYWKIWKNAEKMSLNGSNQHPPKQGDGSLNVTKRVIWKESLVTKRKQIIFICCVSKAEKV